MTPVRTGLPHASTTFLLDEALSATEPPEARGVARDNVRLLVASPSRIRHTQFRSFAEHLAPGDLVVVRSSGAYGFAMASNYNSRPRAAEVLVERGRYGVVTEREDYSDLVRKEKVEPDWRPA